MLEYLKRRKKSGCVFVKGEKCVNIVMVCFDSPHVRDYIEEALVLTAAVKPLLWISGRTIYQPVSMPEEAH